MVVEVKLDVDDKSLVESFSAKSHSVICSIQLGRRPSGTNARPRPPEARYQKRLAPRRAPGDEFRALRNRNRDARTSSPRMVYVGALMAQVITRNVSRQKRTQDIAHVASLLILSFSVSYSIPTFSTRINTQVLS